MLRFNLSLSEGGELFHPESRIPDPGLTRSRIQDPQSIFNLKKLTLSSQK
jgi:hypothetical protein